METKRDETLTSLAQLDADMAHLARDPEIARFRQSRLSLASDPYRPSYHFVSPEGNLNDPNGLCFWRGAWHLFYQWIPPHDPCPYWGHAVSADLIHWRDLPHAFGPGPEQSSWSGATLVEDERVIAMYFAYPLGNMTAVADDPLLTQWHKLAQTAVIPCAGPIWHRLTRDESEHGVVGPFPEGAINSVYDPCIWKKGDWYYSLSGGTLPHPPSGRRTRAEFLSRSRDLISWEYLHPFVEGDAFGHIGDDGACPYFWPIGDKHILLHYSHMSGSKYLLGNYDTARDRFVAVSGGDFTFGPSGPYGDASRGSIHAPTATPDGMGGIIAMFNINAGRPTHGWDQIVSLPRRLTVDGDRLAMEPAGAVESLRGDHVHVGETEMAANREFTFDGITGNTLEIEAEIVTPGKGMIEMHVLHAPDGSETTRIAFFKQRGHMDWRRTDDTWNRIGEACDSLIMLDASRASLLPDVCIRPPEIAPVYLAPDEPLSLRIFIDRSVVEVFVNGRQALAQRVYPSRTDSLGISITARGQGALLRRLDAWKMKSIYPVDSTIPEPTR